MTWQFSADPERQALYEQSLPVRQYLEADRAGDGDGAYGRLSADGIQVARRTIAKYRESLGIPPSGERRRAATR